MRERVDILNRIASKGGIMGVVATNCLKDGGTFNGNLFLIECFEQCHNNSVQEFWGIEIIVDIILYNIKNNGKGKLDLVKARLDSILIGK